MDKLKLTLLVGAPGSGKTTWGKKFCENTPNTIRLCPDEFRAKFGWGEGDQSVSAQAFAATREELGKALDEGKNVVIDATNMYCKSRRDFIDIARKRGAQITAVVFECSKEILIERNIKRGKEGGRNVPEYVIDSMLSKYQIPYRPEVDNVIMVSRIKNL